MSPPDNEELLIGQLKLSRKPIAKQSKLILHVSLLGSIVLGWTQMIETACPFSNLDNLRRKK
jgi:hypothetical protein